MLVSTLAASSHISSVAIDTARVTITAPIDVVGGSPALLLRWQAAIHGAWNLGNDGKPFRICGRDVMFVADMKPRDAMAGRGAHLLFIERPTPNRRIVSTVWHVDAAPTAKARTAFWASDLRENIVAHEFGHLLGLGDEYVDADHDGNGVPEPGEGTVPDVARYPDAWLSLMAFEQGVVLERHVREALVWHGAAHALDCENSAGRLDMPRAPVSRRP